MCTAITLKTKDFYFGRTLDYDVSYGENVCIVGRNFPIKLRFLEEIKSHYAIIGTAHISENFPLFYDAANEKGLCIAGLNFVNNAHYNDFDKSKNNVALFELIPYVLSQCDSVDNAVKLIQSINVTNTDFSPSLTCAELHFLLADHKRAVTIEFVKDGLKIYQNPVGVLTNNPPFDIQLFSLNNYSHLSARDTESHFGNGIKLQKYSRGLSAFSLPGDFSSQSRFIRASFLKLNSVCGDDETDSVNQFFHILGSVSQVRGSCVLENGECEITIYSNCINAKRGIYYYTTYQNRQITAINMHNENLDCDFLIRFPFISENNINFAN